MDACGSGMRGRRRGRVKPVVIGISLVSLLGGHSAWADDPLFAAVAVTHVRGEVPAPAFELPTPDGKTLGLAGVQGKVVLLNFWATWCPPCREEMPSMERLYRELRDQGLAILAVDVQESPKQVARFMRDFQLSFPAVLDTDGKVSGLYSVRGLPTTVLIDRRGRVAGHAIGPRDWASPQAVALVRALLAAPAAHP